MRYNHGSDTPGPPRRPAAAMGLPPPRSATAYRGPYADSMPSDGDAERGDLTSIHNMAGRQDHNYRSDSLPRQYGGRRRVRIWQCVRGRCAVDRRTASSGRLRGHVPRHIGSSSRRSSYRPWPRSVIHCRSGLARGTGTQNEEGRCFVQASPPRANLDASGSVLAPRQCPRWHMMTKDCSAVTGPLKTHDCSNLVHAVIASATEGAAPSDVGPRNAQPLSRRSSC